MNKKKILKFILKLAVSLFFLIWVFLKVNWTDFFSYLASANVWLIIVYILVVFLGMLISSYKWKILTDFKNLNFSVWELFKLYLTGTFINNFMPSFVGGDTYKAYEIGKSEKKYSAAASSVIMDRITGLIAATILAVIFSILNYKAVIKSDILIIANCLVVLSLAFDFAVANVKKIDFIRRLSVRFIPEKIINFLHELGQYNNNSGILKKSIIMGGLFSFVGMAMANYILFLSLGLKINLLDYLSVIFMITIVSSIPITVNNIGLKEWSYVTFFSVFGINTSLILVVSILSRFIQMIMSFAALPMYLRSKNKLSKEAAQSDLE